MNIPDEKLEKIKELLYKQGLARDINTDDNYFLKKKHYSRFMVLIKWMRQNKINPNKLTLNNAYKADVVVRRMISEILKPIELEIEAHLIYMFDIENINIEDLINGEVYESLDSIHKSIYNSKIDTINFVNKVLKKSMGKRFNVQKAIIKMSFGHVVALISILSVEFIEKLFNTSDKVKIINTLNNVVALRNHIAHHNIIFSIEPIHIFNKKIHIKEIIKQLSNLAEGNYLLELQDKITNYEKNIINKYYSDAESDKQQIENLFTMMKKHLINI